MADFADRAAPDTIVLFDVDGTLTQPRKVWVIGPEMKATLLELRKKCVVGIVGGSDFVKIDEQLSGEALDLVDFCFAENGLVAFKGKQELASDDFLGFIGEERLQEFINFTLRYIADLKIPQKRGTFVEYRRGMLNVSPIGRNCSHAERDAFNAFDKEHNIRATMVAVLQKEFAHFGLKFSIGGQVPVPQWCEVYRNICAQISFDVFPVGWDKTYCLRHLAAYNFKTIHFFGDKTYEGGNDFEIYTSPATVGHAVTQPADTIAQLAAIFHM